MDNCVNDEHEDSIRKYLGEKKYKTKWWIKIDIIKYWNEDVIHRDINYNETKQSGYL